MSDSCALKLGFRFIFLMTVCGLVLTACGKTAAVNESGSADAPHSFAGQTISLIIGLDASAGGTTVGRLLAKHLAENLEGHPNVIVNNMPGASGLNAHLYVLNKARKDGTSVYYGPRSSLGELLKLPGFAFKYSQFTPLGGVQIAGLVVYARTDALPGGVSGPKELISSSQPLLFGAMPPEHGRMIISTMGLDLIRAHYKYIAGYPSSGAIQASVISGEVNLATDAAHTYLNQVVPVLVEQGRAVPIFSMPVQNPDGALVQNPLVPDIPSLPIVYESLYHQPPSGILWDSIKTLLELDQTMQHVFLGPPGMDPAAATAFRIGLEKAMTSPAYIKDAQAILHYVPGLVTYQREAEILNATSTVSPEVLQFIKTHIAKNSSY
jgi:hypothetical protein